MDKYKILLKEHLESVVLSGCNVNDFADYKEFIEYIVEELTLLSDSL